MRPQFRRVADSAHLAAPAEPAGTDSAEPPLEGPLGLQSQLLLAATHSRWLSEPQHRPPVLRGRLSPALWH